MTFCCSCPCAQVAALENQLASTIAAAAVSSSSSSSSSTAAMGSPFAVPALAGGGSVLRRSLDSGGGGGGGGFIQRQPPPPLSHLSPTPHSPPPPHHWQRGRHRRTVTSHCPSKCSHDEAGAGNCPLLPLLFAPGARASQPLAGACVEGGRDSCQGRYKCKAGAASPTAQNRGPRPPYPPLSPIPPTLECLTSFPPPPPHRLEKKRRRFAN